MIKERNVSVNVNYNKETIEHARKVNIQMDLMGTVFFVLKSLYEEKFELLDYTDDENKERRMLILYNQLLHRGLIEKDPTNKALYRLTNKGNDVVLALKGPDDEVLVVEVNTDLETESVQQITGDPVGGWIAEWMNLFPDNNGEGRPLKTHPLHLALKMSKFMAKYGYDKDVIIKATKCYIDSQNRSVDGHKYTRTANYFIAKGVGTSYTSDLADWCERVKNGDFEEDHPDIHLMDMV